jgi:hypothetical protein
MMRKLLTKLVACCLVILSGPAAAAQIGAGAGQAQSREASAGDEKLARWGALGRFAGKDLVCQACEPANISLLRWEVPGQVLRMITQNEYGTSVSVFRIESDGQRRFDSYWVKIEKDGTLTPQLKARGVTGPAKFNLRWTLEADGSVITYGDPPRNKPVTRFRADGDQLAVDWDRKEGWRFGFARREIGASDSRAALLAATLRQQARLEAPGATMRAEAATAAPASQQSALNEASPSPELQAFLTPPAAAAPAKTFAPGPGTDRRVALVVGIGNYANLGSLPNPTKDARAIATRLRAVGFDVDLVLEADQRTLKAAIARLGERMSRAGSGATGLFFFAGHGIQSRGINYLIPANAQIAREADVDLEAVAADTVLMQMQEAAGSTNIVILDACRNMPLTRSFRSSQRGLAQMDAPNGSFIAYSTAPGSVAADGEGENSPFAAALMQELDRPAQPIEAVFRNVRRSVLRDTEGMQVPWDSSSLIEPFYFIPQ